MLHLRQKISGLSIFEVMATMLELLCNLFLSFLHSFSSLVCNLYLNLQFVLCFFFTQFLVGKAIWYIDHIIAENTWHTYYLVIYESSYQVGFLAKAISRGSHFQRDKKNIRHTISSLYHLAENLGPERIVKQLLGQINKIYPINQHSDQSSIHKLFSTFSL